MHSHTHTDNPVASDTDNCHCIICRIVIGEGAKVHFIALLILNVFPITILVGANTVLLTFVSLGSRALRIILQMVTDRMYLRY